MRYRILHKTIFTQNFQVTYFRDVDISRRHTGYFNALALVFNETSQQRNIRSQNAHLKWTECRGLIKR